MYFQVAKRVELILSSVMLFFKSFWKQILQIVLKIVLETDRKKKTTKVSVHPSEKNPLPTKANLPPKIKQKGGQYQKTPKYSDNYSEQNSDRKFIKFCMFQDETDFTSRTFGYTSLSRAEFVIVNVYGKQAPFSNCILAEYLNLTK